MTRAGLALLLLCLGLPARAEMDPSDYEVAPSDMTEQEAAALRQRLAADIAAVRARTEAEAIARQAATQAEAARLDARPPGAQLVDLRCAACHGPDSYQTANLGWLGWQATVWRMQVVNGAGLEWGEQGVIADWLHAQYPPDPGRAAMEWLALVLGSLALPLAWALGRHRKGRK